MQNETIPLVLAGQVRDVAYFDLCQRGSGSERPFHRFSHARADCGCGCGGAGPCVGGLVGGGWHRRIGSGACGLQFGHDAKRSRPRIFGRRVFYLRPGGCEFDQDRNSFCLLRAASNHPRRARLREAFTWEHAANVLCTEYGAIAAQAREFSTKRFGESVEQGDTGVIAPSRSREEYVHHLESNARETAEWAHGLEQRAAAQARGWSIPRIVRRKPA